MAKRRSQDDGRISLGDGEGPTNSPFGGLAGLRDSLPAGEPGPTQKGSPSISGGKTQEGSSSLSGGKIVVRRERKGHGGKTVTRVSGLPQDRLKRLSKALKRGLGCGARVEGDEILVQGEQGERIRDILVQEGLGPIVVC